MADPERAPRLQSLPRLDLAKRRLLDRILTYGTDDEYDFADLGEMLIVEDWLLRCDDLKEKLIKEGWSLLSAGTSSISDVFEKSGRSRKIPYEMGNNETEFYHLQLISESDSGLAPTNPKMIILDSLPVLETDVIEGVPLRGALKQGLKIRWGAFERLERRLIALKKNTGLDPGDIHDENVLLLMDDWGGNQYAELVTVDWAEAKIVPPEERDAPLSLEALHAARDETERLGLFFSEPG